MKPSEKKKLRFTSLAFKNWKNFTNVKVDIQNRVFLVGPNASGKSNLLDAFRFLRDIASEGGGLQEAIRKRGGLSAVRSLSARQNPDVMLEVLLGDDENTRSWKYELCIR